MKIEGYAFKEGLLYDLDHSYILQTGPEEIVQGITDLGQGMAGETLAVEMPYVGRRVRQGERLLSIQPMDPHGMVIRLKAAVSGEIVAINPALEDNPNLVNDAPYADGWLVVIRPDDVSELNNLYGPNELTFQIWVRREIKKMQLHEMRVGRKVTGDPAPDWGFAAFDWPSRVGWLRETSYPIPLAAYIAPDLAKAGMEVGAMLAAASDRELAAVQMAHLSRLPMSDAAPV